MQRAAIVGGVVDARPYRYPMVVGAGHGVCGGTLVDANHVITAAHCVQFAVGNVTFQVDSAAGPRSIAVASCHMNPRYTSLNKECLRSEFRGELSLAASIAALGDRCGILKLPSDCSAGAAAAEFDAGSDVAVLQLARPVPPAALAFESPGASGEIFVNPVRIFDGMPTAVELGGATAVGYGGGLGRRFSLVSPNTVRDVGPALHGSQINGSGVLEPGDSGGPLFTPESTPRLVGVAHSLAEVSDTLVGSTWTMVASGTPVGDWVLSILDQDIDGRSDTACGSELHRGVSATATSDTDQDGDGYLDTEDTYPTVYNPCQVTTDRDGDGVLDDADACAWDPMTSALRGEDPSDLDHDGLVGACDCEADLYNDTWADSDYDLAFDACDNCPGLYNPSQADRDNDGIGDACDPCPDDFSTGLDRDGDGADDACDNCSPPFGSLEPARWYNPLQENCNLEAEQARPGAAIRGDACDDTPCGETRLGTTARDETLSSGRRGRVVRMNRVQVDGRSTTPQQARTGFRFCPCSGAAVDQPFIRTQCLGDQGDGTGLCGLDAIGQYGVSEIRDLHWRQMVMDYPAGVPIFRPEPRVEALANYRPSVEGEFRPDLSAEWKLDADRVRWEVVYGAGSTPSPELPGVLWTHTPGGVRHIGVPGLPGLDLPVDFSDDQRRLTSHYWSGVVAAPTEAPAPFPCLRYVGPYLSNAGCPFCAPAFPAPFLALPGSAGLSCGAPFEPPVLAIPDVPFDLGPLLPVDPAVFQRPDLRWLAPSEPVEWLPQGGTRLLALDAQLQPIMRLLETGQGLGLPPGQGGQGCPNPNTCDTTQFPPAAASALPGAASTAAAPSPGGATPSPDILVLSARRETFWSLGGDARARRGLVVAHPLDADPLYSVQHLALGHVLAASYRAQDDALYVLDEVTRGRGWRRRSQARLLRVSTDGSSPLEVLASWPRLSWNTRYALLPAPGDALWLAASPASGRGLPLHVVLRLEPNASRHGGRVRWRATGFAVGGGTLADVQPRADDRGLSLVVERRHQQEAVGYRPANLHPLRAWELRRCF